MRRATRRTGRRSGIPVPLEAIESGLLFNFRPPLSCLLFRLQESTQVTNAGRMSELAQGLGFQLSNALSSDLVNVSYLLEGVAEAVHQAETHFEKFPFPFGQALKSIRQLFLQQGEAGHV